MKEMLLELEYEILKLNNPEALFIPADILELLENPPDSFCYWDLDEDERDELFFPGGCLCKKCLEEELKDSIYQDQFNLNEIYNSAFIN